MRTSVSLAIVIATCGLARADIPPPPNATKAEIEEWNRAREASDRLRFGFPPGPGPVLPQSKTKQLPFAVIGTGGTGELRLVLPTKLLQELRAAQSWSGSSQVLGPEQIPTVIAGLALSLAVVTGGLWLMRSRRLAFGTLAFILATTTVLGIGCIHTRDKTKTAVNQPPASVLVQTPEGELIGQAILQQTDKEEVQVIVDREAMGSYIASSGIKTEFRDTKSPPPAGEHK